MPNITSLPVAGFLRLSAIIGPQGLIPVSKSTWWEGVRTGRYPKPVKLGPRITAWRIEDIKAFIDNADASPCPSRSGERKHCCD
jgi:predicted DNA-binding transcriptional regulator AlpA